MRMPLEDSLGQMSAGRKQHSLRHCSIYLGLSGSLSEPCLLAGYPHTAWQGMLRGRPLHAQSNPLPAPVESNLEFDSFLGVHVLSVATARTDEVAAEAVGYSAALAEVLLVVEFAAMAAVDLTASL